MNSQQLRVNSEFKKVNSEFNSKFNSELLTESVNSEFIDYKILTLTHLFYSGCIFTVLRVEVLDLVAHCQRVGTQKDPPDGDRLH